MAEQLSLEDAVKFVVDNFVVKGQAFSLHDITRTLREDVNNGELEVPECAVVGQPWAFQIEHDDVREVLNSTDYLAGLPLIKSWAGRYFVYTPDVTANVSSGIGISPVSNSKTDKATITQRVSVYLNNAKKRGFVPTLRQIQNAVKRGRRSTGWTRQELAVVRAGLGF